MVKRKNLEGLKQSMRESLPYLNRSWIMIRYRNSLAYCRYVRRCEDLGLTPGEQTYEQPRVALGSSHVDGQVGLRSVQPASALR